MALPLYVVFTMDCERIGVESSFPGGGGPKIWELSERAIRGFCRILLDKGIAPTLFLTPECAQQHNQMLRDFQSEGVELGIHIHPQSFGDHRHSGYLADYSEELQR